MSAFVFPDPPTAATLADARRDLDGTKLSVKKLAAKIEDAEGRLARIVQESKTAIQALENEKAALEKHLEYTQAYISPMRRLPRELLEQIFLFNFEDYPCCAWVLSSVCSSWRRLALSMPKLWSKIRLVTSSEAPADTVRLWLERSGHKIPLDIEIFLHSPPSAASSSTRPRPPRRTTSNTILIADNWGANDWTPAMTPPPQGIAIPISPYVSVHAAGGTLLPVNLHAQNESMMPPIVGSERPRDTANSSKSRSTTQYWGYIAISYLVEQIHRWERFVFRFDKQFPSVAALKSIVGDAPLLREFEVSCAEGMSSGIPLDWPWLPCAQADSTYKLDQLKSVTLQYVPFKWSTPMLQNLQNLTLRSMPSTYVNTDRVLHIIASCPSLESLSLHFNAVHSAVLPLTPTTLSELKSFNVGGHYNLVAVIDTLILPSLESITFDIDTRDPIEDSLTSLLLRSSHPPLAHLSLSYSSANAGVGVYYGAGSSITSWNFLRDMDTLRTLQVGGTPFESLLMILGTPEDDDRWICPNLTKLNMRACQAHTNGAAKLVRLVDARNPDHTGGSMLAQFGGGTAPAKLRHLEVHDCAVLGEDVIEWLKNRIDEVICTEPMYDSSIYSPRSPPYHDTYV
ncbi:unnamed protein product [Somion occarium]|uniref:F-box domain-containing protein n=1 Tax=Somion occarium TaxID=3059160 RepID=A0ABP1DMR5_9APHY